MKLLIIDNYDSFTFNLVQLVEQAGLSNYLIVKNDELDKLKSNDFNRVIISPGSGIAKEAGQLMWFLQEFYTTKPMLGICLGHEAIAELFGAKLVHLKKPMHGIKNKGHIVIEDKIFDELPNSFNIGHYHSWILDERSLTNEFEIILRDENNLNMAIKHKRFDLTGLQYHPESVMTEYGLEMMKNWL